MYGPAGWSSVVRDNKPVDYQHVIFQPEALGHRYIYFIKYYSDNEQCGIQNTNYNVMTFWSEAYNKALIMQFGKFDKEGDITAILSNNIARGYAYIHEDRLVSKTNKPNTAVCRTSIILNTTPDLHPQE